MSNKINTDWTQERINLTVDYAFSNNIKGVSLELYKLDETYLYKTITDYDLQKNPQRKTNLIANLKQLKTLEKVETNANLEPTMKQLYLENNWTTFVDDLEDSPKFALDCLKEIIDSKIKIIDDEGNDKQFWVIKTLIETITDDKSSNKERNNYIELLCPNKIFGIKENEAESELKNFINKCELHFENNIQKATSKKIKI